MIETVRKGLQILVGTALPLILGIFLSLFQH